MKYYIAYGSNLNAQQMLYRCPTAKAVGTSEIHGYELLFKGSKTGSYLTIEKSNNGIVPIAVWSVTAQDELALDRYEGFPNFYYKKNMRVKVNGKTVTAFVYIMHEDRPLGIPSRYYITTCMTGYRHFRFDEEILVKAIERSISHEK